jgi:hypothetical protein
LHRGASLSWPV